MTAGFIQSGRKNRLIGTLPDKISVLVPFRNEEKNIAHLIEDFLLQPERENIELILIDDHSEDNSVTLIERYLSKGIDLRLVKSNGKGKVAALNTGLSIADNDCILSMDADVRLGSKWTESLFQNLSMNSDMTILPVKASKASGFVENYALLDFMSLIGVTFGTAYWNAPIMANGAQLMVKKDKVNWQNRTVSGDDVFALHDFKRRKLVIDYNASNELAVETKMPNSWPALLSQRKRWASKSSHYRDGHTLFLGWFTLVFNLWVWVLLIATSLSLIPNFLTLSFIGIKALVDFIFLYSVLTRFNLRSSLVIYPIAFLLNLCLLPVVFVLSKTSEFSWKNRVYGND